MRTIAAAILIITLALVTPSCVGSTIHGLDEVAWFELLARGESLPIKAGEKVDYDAIERLGPGAILFLGMRAQVNRNDSLAIAMFSEAVRRETGRYRTRATALLGDSLLAAKDGPGLVELCQSDAGVELSPYRRYYLEASGLFLSALYSQALATIDTMRSAYPAEAGRDAAEIAAMALEAGFRAGHGRWVDEFSAITAMDGSTRVYAALSTIVGLVGSSSLNDAATAIRAVGPGTFQLAQARALSGAREFGPAILAFRRYAAGIESPESIAERIHSLTPATGGQESAIVITDYAALPLTPKLAANLFLMLPRAAASDAAKAFIATSREEGAGGFRTIVQSTLDRGADPSRAYFDAYWHARFLRDAGSWQEAGAWFWKAAGLAASHSERDAAAWYAVEASLKQSRAAAIPALGKALAASRNPGYYADLIEPLSREALVARDGKALAALDAAVSALASGRDAARLAYLCARAAQSGIITDAQVTAAFVGIYKNADAYAEARLRAAYNQKSDDWYRLAAAYRLGEPLFAQLAPSEDTGSTAVVALPEAKEASAVVPADIGPEDVGPDEYALGMARFGLGHRLRAELGTEFGLLTKDTVRQVAEALWNADRHDHAYRLIATQFWKADFIPTRRDAELYWPRPYRDIFTAAALATGMDEFLLYGLARSESAFDRVVVSKSGAVGLTQLMPATAAEMAERLRLTGYDLTDPVDNVTIGSAYFARILSGVNGRVLPAVFSYNGGPTRFRRWEAEYGNLPLDLMLEALSYEETRQYGRNVVTAALSYAALYGEGDLRAYFSWLLGETPHP